MEGLKRVWLAAALISIPGLNTSLAQRRPDRNTQGSLTVTLRVESSVGIFVEPNGEQHIIAPNSIDPADNVSRIEYVQLSPAKNDEQKQSHEIKETDHRQNQIADSPGILAVRGSHGHKLL
jgi:hypothetical protein